MLLCCMEGFAKMGRRTIERERGERGRKEMIKTQ
jgi:hypothetical protein